MERARSLSVLIVEDNKDGAETLAILLETYGHDVKTALHGDAALDVAREFPPDAVILDIGLPGMDGFEVADKLFSLLSPRPLVIVVTGYARMRAKCLASGIDHCLVKPAHPSAINEILVRHAESLARAREQSVAWS